MSEPWRRSRQTWWRRPSVDTQLVSSLVDDAAKEDILLGTAKSSRSFRLLPRVSVMNGRLLLPLRALFRMPLTPFVYSIFVQAIRKEE